MKIFDTAKLLYVLQATG